MERDRTRSNGDEPGEPIPLVDLQSQGQSPQPIPDPKSAQRLNWLTATFSRKPPSAAEENGEAAEDVHSEGNRWKSGTRVRAHRVGQLQLSPEMAFYKYELMAEWVYLDLLAKTMVTNPNPGDEGVVVKICPGEYTCFPPLMEFHPNSVYQVVKQLNIAVSPSSGRDSSNARLTCCPQCALTVRVAWVSTLIEAVSGSGASRVPLLDGRRIEILKTVTDLVKEQQHHFAALIVDTQMLLVWGDNPKELCAWAEELQEKVLLMLAESEMSSEVPIQNRNDPLGLLQPHPTKFSYDDSSEQEDKRRVRVTNAWLMAVSIFLCLASLGLGWRKIAMEITVDGDWTRVLFVLVVLPMILTSQVSCSRITVDYNVP